LSDDFPWVSIHSGWASALAERLNTILPPRYYALENKRFGTEVEIDIGTYDREPLDSNATANGPATATLPAPVWSPPAPRKTIRPQFPDTLEVRVFLREGRPKLVGAIELVSPRNKDRPAARAAFVAKCAAYLTDGVSLVVLDAVTVRRAHLHFELMTLFETADPNDEVLTMFAGAYRPVVREERGEIDVWTEPVSVGAELPTMPLRLTGDLMVPVEFEVSYMDVCRKRRML
jgi:hypothetical protein